MQAAFSLQLSAFISWLNFVPLFFVPCIFKTICSETQKKTIYASTEAAIQLIFGLHLFLMHLKSLIAGLWKENIFFLCPSWQANQKEDKLPAK